jgi:hypothetical protein
LTSTTVATRRGHSISVASNPRALLPSRFSVYDRGVAEDGESRLKDGLAWRIGSDDDVAWIGENTPGGTAITSAIPAVFNDYATIKHPGELGVPRNYAHEGEQDRALLALLTAATPSQPWWLGYLDTGASDVVFWDVPKVTLYAGWH